MISQNCHEFKLSLPFCLRVYKILSLCNFTTSFFFFIFLLTILCSCSQLKGMWILGLPRPLFICTFVKKKKIPGALPLLQELCQTIGRSHNRKSLRNSCSPNKLKITICSYKIIIGERACFVSTLGQEFIVTTGAWSPSPRRDIPAET